jgi:hypothetical protein
MLAAMGTDVVADLFSALVAAGTLGLAGATFRLGGATSRTAVDAVSPRLVVTSFLVEGHALNRPWDEYAQPAPGDSISAWSIKRLGKSHAGLRARGHLRNEGTVTALFRFECDPGCEVEFVGDPVPGQVPLQPKRDPGWASPELPKETGGVPIVQQDGWYLLSPGGEANFAFIWWRLLAAWVQAWQNSSQQVPTVTCHLIVRGTTGEARDECNLTFGRHVVVPGRRANTWTTPVYGEYTSSPALQPDPVASVGLMKRTYPRSSWGWWPWKGGDRVTQPAIAAAEEQALAEPETEK